MDLSLEGKLALVGGASQGIGRATAHLFAERGAKVILMLRRLDVLESVRTSLPNSSRHRCFAIDVERNEELGLHLSRLVLETGPVSIWINNTGGPKPGILQEATIDEMERAFRGHVLASQVILRALLPGMKSLKFGRIINVLSTSVKMPIPNLGVSNIMRAGMASWAKTLSQELGPFGITVNNILPGFTETPRLLTIASDAAARGGGSEAEIRKGWADSVPLKRLAEPEETAMAIGFLASLQASYITGTSLPVDGGRTGAF
jgi:3-oxoacyl-[acyl-carrier protein] reductase